MSKAAIILPELAKAGVSPELIVRYTNAVIEDYKLNVVAPAIVEGTNIGIILETFDLEIVPKRPKGFKL